MHTLIRRYFRRLYSSIFSGLSMRSSILALSFIAALVPCTGFAAPAGAPCDLMDREAFAALKLDSATQSSERKEMQAAKGAPKQEVRTCNIAAADPSLPSLMITSVKAPPNVNYGKASCTLQPIHKDAMSMCNATIKNAFVTFVMMSKAAAGPATKAALLAQVERLSK
jgi:hypothetical protein